MKTKFRGDQCRVCEKTHEECRDTTCVKASLSAYVCSMFGIPPNRRTKRARG